MKHVKLLILVPLCVLAATATALAIDSATGVHNFEGKTKLRSDLSNNDTSLWKRADFDEAASAFGDIATTPAVTFACKPAGDICDRIVARLRGFNPHTLKATTLRPGELLRTSFDVEHQISDCHIPIYFATTLSYRASIVTTSIVANPAPDPIKFGLRIDSGGTLARTGEGTYYGFGACRTYARMIGDGIADELRKNASQTVERSTHTSATW